MFQNSDNSSYTNNSGNSYTYVTNYVSVDHSFNTTHSHNGHGRFAGCGLIVPVLLVAVPLVVSIIFCNVLAGWLT